MIYNIISYHKRKEINNFLFWNSQLKGELRTGNWETV